MTKTRHLNPLVPARSRLLAALVGVLALVAGACGGDDNADTSSGEAAATTVPAVDEPAVSDEDPAEEPTVRESGATAPVPLPVRAGPRTETTHSVPHVQTFVELVPDVDAELRRRIYSLPGVENRDTIVSFTGTTALWLSEDFEPSNLAATMREREFGHVHTDGSLHTVLPVARALEATSTKWAELHPWVGREDLWDGMVMLYTPQSFEELETTWQLIVDSYNFVTGQNLDAIDFVAY